MQHADVVIAGAGLIGASLALELADRGLRVALLSEGEPLEHASTAAAGMLAVDDPDNPAALYPLAAFSRALYPERLARLAQISGAESVRFQTRETLQALSPHHPHSQKLLTGTDLHALAPGLITREHLFTLLEEASLDPRELAIAVRLALAHSPLVDLHTQARVLEVTEEHASVTAHATGLSITAAHFADCTGAWSLASTGRSTVPVRPRKGQILSVALPPEPPLTRVIRTPTVYIVPRLHGPRAGQAVIGATVEDRGFNTTVEPHAIAALQAEAATLLPALAIAPILDAWCGLRPTTPDLLPVLGRIGERTFISKGHFRNGILLAPASAHVLADLITGRDPAIDLAPFSPERTLTPTAAAEPASNHTAEILARDPHLV